MQDPHVPTRPHAPPGGPPARPAETPPVPYLTVVMPAGRWA